MGSQGLNLSRNRDLTFIDALQSSLGLQGVAIGDVESTLLKAIDEAKATSMRIVLVLDGIDFLLAATEATVEDVLDSISELREVCHSSIVSSGVTVLSLRGRKDPDSNSSMSTQPSSRHPQIIL